MPTRREHRADRRRSLSLAPGFEPPLAAGAPAKPGPPPCRRTAPRAAAAVREYAAARRSPHDGRSASSGTPDETASAATRFAERSMRVVLEVLDGRRPVTQLRPLATPTVVAAVETLLRTGGGRHLGPAVLVSVRATFVTSAAVEVCGGYDRGDRHFAMAARIVTRRGGWRLAALRLR
ncbi:Rv3235 family protein [Nocardia terpenica]|uniref:Alanine, arginine and proline rich protein n=1 Tax=Nocardia terpenica TaxID=455432 RepID=A0A6G9ZA97_9NOCA|nr:Rv3235 family protein [Nocardia terpenica]QIS22384.1 hypothetical protein F6W96_32660 [Nocardia terpenica]